MKGKAMKDSDKILGREHRLTAGIGGRLPRIGVGSLLCAAILLSAVSESASAGVLTWDRIFPEPWRNAGNPAGPPVQARTIDVRDFGAAGDGVSDDRQALLDAVATFGGQPGVVYFPPGDYLIRSAVNLPSGVVLRGHSPSATTLRFDFLEHAINFVGSVTGSWIPFSAAGGLRSRTIDLSSAEGLATGQYAVVTQDNDPAWNITDSWAAGSAGQVVRITRVEGNRIHLERPLRHDYPLGRNPRFRRLQPNLNSGIENLRLVREVAGDNSSRNNKSTVRFLHAANGWMRGVRSQMAFGSHVSIVNSTRIEITGCDFFEAHDHDGGGSGYGVKMQLRSGECLIQDNVFRRLRHSILLQAGPNGNVISYNYSREGKSDDHPDYAGEIALHGNYPYANLFEGNIVGHIWVDNSHNGANGPLNTFFRNRAEVAGFNISDPEADRQNVVGNELYRGNWIARLWVGDGYKLEGSGHFAYGNYSEADGLHPSGTGDLSDYSYYLNADPTVPPPKPEWWTIADDFPVIGPPRSFSTAKNIPARARWVAAGELTVPARIPKLGLAASTLSLVEGSAQSVGFTLANHGDATLNWQIGPVRYGAGSQNWITGFSPASGLLEPGESVEVVLQADRSLLDGETYSAGVDVRSNGGEGVLAVEAAGIRYQIDTQAGRGGTIQPADPEVLQGEDVLFSIEPNAYYQLADVRVDGTSIGAVGQYHWQSVEAAGSLSAEFIPETVDSAPVPVPKAWLAGHGITSGMDEAVLQDVDGDGFEVWREYVLDTAPNNPASFFSSDIEHLSDFDSLRIRFDPASIDRIYTLQHSPGLDADSWQNVPGEGPRAGSGGEEVMIVPRPGEDKSFYRIRVELP